MPRRPTHATTSRVEWELTCTKPSMTAGGWRRYSSRSGKTCPVALIRSYHGKTPPLHEKQRATAPSCPTNCLRRMHRQRQAPDERPQFAAARIVPDPLVQGVAPLAPHLVDKLYPRSRSCSWAASG
jgi:hypothetical protein